MRYHGRRELAVAAYNRAAAREGQPAENLEDSQNPIIRLFEVLEQPELDLESLRALRADFEALLQLFDGPASDPFVRDLGNVGRERFDAFIAALEASAEDDDAFAALQALGRGELSGARGGKVASAAFDFIRTRRSVVTAMPRIAMPASFASSPHLACGFTGRALRFRLTTRRISAVASRRRPAGRCSAPLAQRRRFPPTCICNAFA